ncbi:DUF1674 domain-containing protein [Glacieibacterium frigidum]|uniref:DUF1674 domain-containing protein n=1 Tax=Glacieibacterium frigidum TaxID=2593303 RepID=A0A552UFA8_9SPHN|nr:DUF1674 domain-containing protein [Glacieibacterium frigidum]TRW16908.1 DUF1674 domain-containing protein [Glacieibacterium frigidum]
MASRPDYEDDDLPPGLLPAEPEPEMEPSVLPEPEMGGRGGLDPVRYGDWEKGGIAVDF